MDSHEQDKLAAFFESGLPEYRSVPFLDLETKNDGWTFEGLAAVYGEGAEVDGFTEEFARGSFRKPLANGDNTRLIHEHSPAWVPVIATVRAKTMTLKDDVKGLVVRADIAKHYVGEAVRESIRRGDIKGMSPGMIVGRGNSEVNWTADGKPHRVIRALKHLPELSLTPDPVYSGTTAEMRSLWALQMADTLGGAQHAFLGAYQQLESRAVTESPASVDTDAAEPAPTCKECGEPLQGDEPCNCTQEEPAQDGTDDVPEQRAGASPQDEAAARRRRLHLMGLTLPH